MAAPLNNVQQPVNPLAAGIVADPEADHVKAHFQNFLETFEPQQAEESTMQPSKPYVDQVKSMKQDHKSTLFVDYSHIPSSLQDQIQKNYYRFEPYLQRAVQNFVRTVDDEYTQDERGHAREFYVSVHNFDSVSKIRDLKADKVGQLMSISGTVTRTSEVRPELLVGVFRCLDCTALSRDVPQQFRYSEPSHCSNPSCENHTRWSLERTLSKFVDWQRVRIQENANEIPPGSMPRTLDVVLRHEVVDMAKPGDKCIFTGSLVVVPDVAALGVFSATESTGRHQNRGRDNNYEGVRGLHQLGVRDLSFRLCFLASSVQSAHSKSASINIRSDEAEVPREEVQEVRAMMGDSNSVYQRLANSIAPSVWGHGEIKRGILLMLFGGVHKTTPEGIQLRGDINVCIIGDPSTAKSQFLKYVAGFLPRAVFTSGKASSAAGLTASVIKDPETGEFGIEAGALMLADNGICCIDEFDKMDPKDQVAIHEAMEQQTISISKAGIQATLNARTSILAAANPIGGRYDKRKPLKANVDMSAAIMSRFDLLFVVMDECDEVVDYGIARHIAGVHAHPDAVSADVDFTSQQLQKYIRFARTIKPKMGAAAVRLMNLYWRRLRSAEASSGTSSSGLAGSTAYSYRITVRQLEALVRLSEAIARAHLEEEVSTNHVREAARLLKRSIMNVELDDIPLDDDLGDLSGDGTGFPPHPPPAPSAAASASASSSSSSSMDIDSKQPAAAPTARGPASSKRTVVIRMADYIQMADRLLKGVRSLLENSDREGVTQEELVNWYMEDEMQRPDMDAAAAAQQRRVLAKVLDRMVDHDYMLQQIRPADEPIERRLLRPNENYDADAADAAASQKG